MPGGDDLRDCEGDIHDGRFVLGRVCEGDIVHAENHFDSALHTLHGTWFRKGELHDFVADWPTSQDASRRIQSTLF